MPVSRVSTDSKVTQGAEIAYYMTAVVALAVGALGTQGLFGYSFQNFMHHTVNALPSMHWLALGASVILVPQVLKLAGKTGSATKGLTHQKQEEALLKARQRLKHASEEIAAFEKSPPQKVEAAPDPVPLLGKDILGFTSEAYVSAIIKLIRGY